MRKRSADAPQFVAHIELLEDRKLMTADPLADLGPALVHHDLDESAPLLEHASSIDLPDPLPPLSQHLLGEPDFIADPINEDLSLDEYFQRVEQQLTEAHQQTGWFNVQQNYGFSGKGQTVVVIDSGIAYNHAALGGGFGAGYRVVGGWDFTEENDNNPYDDGPSGGHGTHVAGIIGSSNSTNHGVASGVDLVGLRVFNDAGQGYFSWVESALQWVHAHRNDFANPITAINLSLGVSTWNAYTNPSWANLEEELAQLKADGIFIAVSAGNSYASYNTPGLSYPASSPNVVPVMSVDDNGTLSYYSQRLARAIAAPGRSIISTIPDYKGNNNGVGDDYASMSGTSMASPYVAGASVLIRQAMQFVGYTNITQTMIYDHMMATADVITDGALSYKKLNLGRAIDALMPTDDFGSTLSTAHNMGTLTSNQTFSGAIARLNDIDMFKFTAGSTGSVSFTVTQSREEMAAAWQVFNSSGAVVATSAGAYLSFNAVSGQTYTVGLSSSAGVGHYSFTAAAQGGGAFTYTDWGSVSFSQINNVAATGQTWYRITAAQAGYLTAQGTFNASGGNVALDLYDLNLNLVASGTTASGVAKATVNAAANSQYYVRVSGVNSDVDFTLCNLVSKNGATLTVQGTANNDSFVFVAGTSNHSVTVNGVAYSFGNTQVTAVNFVGGAGTDSVVLSGTTAADTATLRFGSASIASSAYSASATSVESVTIHSGGGADTAYLYDTAGNDVYSAYKDRAGMSNAAGSIMAWNFAKTIAYASGGYDVAHLYDSAGDDLFDAYKDRVDMIGSGFANSALNFDVALGYASTGYDRAFSHDSAGNDVYDTYKDRAVMYGAGYATHAVGFDYTLGYASTGDDHAYMHDSAGDDMLDAYRDRVVMSGAGYQNHALNFDFSQSIASTGNDRAYMHDSAGDDIYDAYSNRVSMRGAGFSNNALNFKTTFAYGSGGNDRAYLYDSTGNDVARTWTNRGEMTGANYDNKVDGFEGVYAFATAGGYDEVYAYDSAGDDTLQTWDDHAVLYGDGFFNYFKAFDKVYAYATGGFDNAYFYDSSGNDLYRAWSNRASMSGATFYNYAQDFDRTFGFSSSGADEALLYDSAGDDSFQSWSDRAVFSGSGFYNYVEHFAKVTAAAGNGNDSAYMYDSSGNDSYFAQGTLARMIGAGYRNEAQGFKNTVANMSTGSDQVTLDDTAAADFLTIRAWGAVLQSEAYRNEVRGCSGLTAKSQLGGNDRKDVATVDYLYSLVGAWS
jgi:hypothetical protein